MICVMPLVDLEGCVRFLPVIAASLNIFHWNNNDEQLREWPGSFLAVDVDGRELLEVGDGHVGDEGVELVR